MVKYTNNKNFATTNNDDMTKNCSDNINCENTGTVTHFDGIANCENNN